MRRALMLILSGCLTGCMAVSSTLTGVGLIYDRHNVYIRFNDFQLVSQIRHAIYRDGLFKGPDASVDMAAFNGDVLLAGHVATAAMRDELYARVAQLDMDYRRLFKQVALGLPDENGVEDLWITTKIRAQIIADSSLDPHKFKVVTVGGLVYLLGDVELNQAARVIDIARTTQGVRRVVKLMQYYQLTSRST